MKEFPGTFSKLLISMVGAGEESGSLADSLTIVSVQMDNIYKLQKKVKGAMLYPLIIVVVMFIIGTLMLIYVVPGLTKTFKEVNVSLPLSTRSIIFASDMIKNHSASVFVVMAIIIGISYAWTRTRKGKIALDFLVLHFPAISTITKETNAARTARTLSALLSSGVPIGQALSITSDVVQNSYYKQVLNESKISVEKGGSISDVFVKMTIYTRFCGRNDQCR